MSEGIAEVIMMLVAVNGAAVVVLVPLSFIGSALALDGLDRCPLSAFWILWRSARCRVDRDGAPPAGEGPMPRRAREANDRTRGKSVHRSPPLRIGAGSPAMPREQDFSLPVSPPAVIRRLEW